MIPTDQSHLPLAIVGMACRLPGAANLDEYWQLIRDGKSAIAEVPPERLDQAVYYHPQKGMRAKTYSKMAALLADRTFDHSRCPLPAEIVRNADNTHLLMTGVAAEALRHGGLDPFNLPTRNVAVFIGHAQGSSLLERLSLHSSLEDLLALLNDTEAFAALPAHEREAVRREVTAALGERTPTGAENSRNLQCNMVAGTIAKAFGLTGPWLALNSACASSLHAIQLGARALQSGRAEMAIVGGASDCKSDSLVLFSNAQAMSPNSSRPFDADADGLVISEGYVALVMKTLSQAVADGDPVQAVVRGVGLASDGRGKSLWAPRKEGQLKAMQRAYRSGVELAGLQYLECHATATQVGDATEMETLNEAFGPVFPPGKKIPITSVKANIGHALEAAGGAGIIKTVLCMQHQTIPPAINISNLNPKVDWATAPYYVPQRPERWEAPADGSPRRAAVNAFGIGGMNMHVVLDEFTAASRKPLPSISNRPVASEDDRAVAIIGIGCILPGAIGSAQYWDLLASGRDPKIPAPAGRWTDRAIAAHTQRGLNTLGGFITNYQYDWRKHKVPPKQVAEADPLQFMLLDATEQALADAGYKEKPWDRERCGVVVGTEFGGEFADQLEFGLRIPLMQHFLAASLRDRGLTDDNIQHSLQKFSDNVVKKYPSLIDETGSFTSSTLASRISKTLDLAGGAVAIDSGATSAMSALSLCVDTLLAGDNDMMICASGQRRMGLSTYLLFEASRMLSPNGSRSMLDANFDGIVPGEGAGVVVLKRLKDARRDGDPIHAVIRGLGAAHHQHSAEALRLAVERATTVSNIDSREIQFSEWDCDESWATTKELFDALATSINGQAAPAQYAGSAAAQLGHLGGAASMASLLKAILQLKHGQTTTPLDLQRARSGGTISTQPTKLATSGRRFGAVTCWSKGQAIHVVLEHGAPVIEQAPAHVQIPVKQSAKSHSHRICRFAAGSRMELSKRIDLALNDRDEAAAFAASSAAQFHVSDRARLAIVADSPAALRKKLQLCRSQLNAPAAASVLEEQGIFAREVPKQRVRVAFVFPGQGSQYAGMMRELASENRAVAAELERGDAILQNLTHPSFAELAWSPSNQLGKEIWPTQLAMLIADNLAFAALKEIGIVPDVVLGHSYGEFPALLAAGVFDLETAIVLTKARCDGIATSQQHTGLLATDAPRGEIDAILPRIARELFVANANSPDQHVIGGRVADLQRLAQALQDQKRQARILPVPAAFHTPLLTGASHLLEQSLRTATLHPPRVKFVSTVTNRPHIDCGEIARNLAIQLTTPVRYAELIAQLAAEQPTLFIEVGPSRMLTRLNRRILSDHSEKMGVNVVGCDQPNRSGRESLLAVQALYECLNSGLPAIVPTTAPPMVASSAIASAPQLTIPRPVPQTAPPSATLATKSSPRQTSAASTSVTMKPEIPHFDATERRRMKMRAAPQPAIASVNATAITPSIVPPQNGPPAPTPSSPATPAYKGNGHGNGNGYGNTSHAPANPALRSNPAPIGAPTVAAPQAAPPQPISPANPAPPASQSPEQLQSFLINFVVEQTGYPPEVVDLDADLEADLGIDSIKKAQLFGELQEYFDVSASNAGGNLALDDFRTLRHVLNFLSGSNTAESPVAPVVATQIAAAPAPAASVAALGSTPPAAELESFLINFVVEQTGYPPEVVDLDADLEADLGIDSIKKAQLFGELQEYFDVSATNTSGNLALDDFRTLRHVLNFLSNSPDLAASSSNSTATLVVEKTAAAPRSGELESFLINFVVEQTGYPPEVVDLDADLEADLGIDSIKKAQLFGELQEYFDISASNAGGNLALDDFRTLRHVLNFLAGSSASTPANLPPGDHPPDTSQIAPAANPSAKSEPQGTPYEMGHAIGLAHQAEILRLLLTAAQASYAHQQLASSNLSDYSPDELDCWQGLADAVQVLLGNILANVPAISAALGAKANWPQGSPMFSGADSKKAHAAPLPEINPHAVTRRYSLTTTNAPLPTESHTAPTWQGDTAILGAGQTTELLRAELHRSGVRVTILSPEKSLDELLSEFNALLARGPLPHLFLLTGRDCPPVNVRDEQGYRAGSHAGWIAPFFICQKWVQAATAGNWLSQSSLVAVTSLGNNLGFGSDSGADENRVGSEMPQGGLGGLLKGLHLELTKMKELPGFRVKVLDFPADASPEMAIATLLRELASSSSTCEVAYDADGRYVASAQEKQFPALADEGIRHGGTWVITGGARGITAACALALGQRYALKLHLIGSSPLPRRDARWGDLSPEAIQSLKTETMIAAKQAGISVSQAWERALKDIEIWRSLESFAAAGVEATYYACDVSNRAALAATLDQIREQSGPIEGVLHGAGIDHSCRFEKKQPEVVLATLGCKVDGAAHLMALTRRDPVRHFIGFSSISGRMSSFGQADYCLASELLSKLIGSYRRERPWIRAASFHWHPWGEIGMAARPAVKSVMEEVSKLTLMPIHEGIGHLLRELAAGLPEPEVLITQEMHWNRYVKDVQAIEAVSSTPTEATFVEFSEPAPELATHRCEMALIPAPLPANTPAMPHFDAPVWIFGDNPAAHAIARILQARGVTVQTISLLPDFASTFAEIERQWAIAPAKTLLLLNACDVPESGEAGDLMQPAGLAARRWKNILLPYFITQRWYKLLLSRPDLGQGTVLAAVSLGGQFGFSGPANSPEGGSVTGFLKALSIENSRKETRAVRTKAVDAPPGTSPELLARNWLRELAADQPEVEVSWHGEERRVVRPLVATRPTAQRTNIPRGGTWVITGGGRGITCVTARELARRFGWKVHLLGKSPAPLADAPWRNYSAEQLKAYKLELSRQAVAAGKSPSEAWDRIMKDVEIHDNLRQFAEAGVEVTYHACDITDRASVEKTLAQVRAQDGRIEGIIHGAGLIDPGRFEHRRTDWVTKLLATKFDGAMNLLSLTEQDRLGWFIGFGSISGRFGGNGLSDYAAGNDVLAKVVDWVRSNRPDCRATCIHWESWEGSGMAALPKYAWGPKTIMNMKYMSWQEGVHRLMQEMQAGLPSREVLYTFGDFYSQFYPQEQFALGEYRPGPLGPVVQETPPKKSTLSKPPLIEPCDGAKQLGEGTWRGHAVLDPQREPFLVQHRLRDKPLLPVVVGLELLLEAVEHSCHRSDGRPNVNAFSNVQVLDGLLFHTDRPGDLQVQTNPGLQADSFEALLTCDFHSRTGKLVHPNRPYLQATVHLGSRPAHQRVELPPRPVNWQDFIYPDSPVVYHGPAFRGVQATSCEAHGGWARLESLPLEELTGTGLGSANRAEGWSIPSCVLDNCFYACGIHLWIFGQQAFALPRAIERLELGRSPRTGETCWLHFTCRGIDQAGAIYDFTLVGEDETLIVSAEGYRKVLVGRGSRP